MKMEDASGGDSYYNDDEKDRIDFGLGAEEDWEEHDWAVGSISKVLVEQPEQTDSEED